MYDTIVLNAKIGSQLTPAVMSPLGVCQEEDLSQTMIDHDIFVHCLLYAADRTGT